MKIIVLTLAFAFHFLTAQASLMQESESGAISSKGFTPSTASSPEKQSPWWSVIPPKTTRPPSPLRISTTLNRLLQVQGVMDEL